MSSRDCSWTVIGMIIHANYILDYLFENDYATEKYMVVSLICYKYFFIENIGKESLMLRTR